MKSYAFFLAALATMFSTFGFSAQVNLGPEKQVQLKEGMRKLWSDHVIWTRGYIVSAVAKHEDAQAAAGRLLKNQDDIGNAIVPYYGKEAGKTLATLLKEHIVIATQVVAAALEHSQEKLKDADKRWHRNADDIADFLSKANPNWSKMDLRTMLYRHLDLTTKEATLRIDKKWKEDVANFDSIFNQGLKMADTLSSGIIKQFTNTPSKIL